MTSRRSTGKATGLACSNCKEDVVSLPDIRFTVTGRELSTRNHCACTLGEYTTNITRAGLQRAFWKGKSA